MPLRASTSVEEQIEVLFERYRRKGDLRALEQVLDRTLVDLFHIALYLVGNPARAKDLVLATGQRVVRQAASWRPAQPLGHWLVAILVDLAGQARMLEISRLAQCRPGDQN